MAVPMWNDSLVSPPPVASCSYTCYEIDEVDVYNLKLALQVMQTSHSVGLGLSSEQYTLSRLLYKANNQQRHWRWYQMLKKIQKSLSKLQANHPVKFWEDAVGCCQINRDQSGLGSIIIHLPARQMLEYILVKLMGQAKLCAYILNTAESVFIFVIQNIKSGQFLAHNVIYASIASRIWVMMRTMLRDILMWYSTLRPWIDKLKATSMQWILAGQVLPDCLQDWLRADYNPDKYSKAIEQTSKTKGSSLLDSMFASTSLATSEPIMTESLTEKDLYNTNVAMAASTAPSMDLGEPIKAGELVENRKRKWLDTSCLQESDAKRSRLEVETRTKETGALASCSSSIQPITKMKKSEQREEKHLGIPKGKKQSKGILKQLKLSLKRKEKGTLQKGDAENENEEVVGLSYRGPEETTRNWSKQLKNKLQKKLRKFKQNSPASNETLSEKKLSIEAQNPIDEEDEVDGKLDSDWLESNLDQNKLKGVSEVTKESKKNKNKVKRGFQKTRKQTKKLKHKEWIQETETEPNYLIGSLGGQHPEDSFSLRHQFPDPSQTGTNYKLEKKIDTSKSKKFQSDKGRQPKICEEYRQINKNGTERIVKSIKKKRRAEFNKSEETKGMYAQPERNAPGAIPKMHQWDYLQTNKKMANSKRDIRTESSVSFKRILRKPKKQRSESSLVCDLSKMTKGKGASCNRNQDSDIDQIFAWLE
ncbi:uncharacterized protein LOC110988873 [Acanthaster planci]|uniref:Uncharacterized protein LOC110988873 n=1 Tax=Acanthaster planci TaxID=133434 RepID=A0A8B7ZUM9_ACAPL|nr:uncharacterized protein LOC110988873 [Acanthaster planci]